MKTLSPRWYQKETFEAFQKDAKNHPLASHILVLPTGAGKTVVMAMIIEWIVKNGGRVCVLARTKELIQQNHDTFQRFSPDLADRTGINCAGLFKRSTGADIIFASIQSVCDRSEKLGKFRLIIVDEAHQVPDNESSQYQKFLMSARKLDPKCKLLGLTASPYRLDGGIVFGPGRQFDRMTHAVPLGVLMEEGHITTPRTLKTKDIDLSKVEKRGNDYDLAQQSSAFMANPIGEEIVAASKTKGTKCNLVFCSSVAHADQVVKELRALGEDAELITGETLPLERETILSNFKAGRLKWLVNIEVLTTGFDATAVDLVVIARMTESPGLFLQMVGRGFRLHEGKDCCWVMDYGGNIERHGAVNSDTYGMNTIKVPSKGGEPPKRICPSCFKVQHASARACSGCGLEFPSKPKVLSASNLDVIEKPVWLEVKGVNYYHNRGKELDDGTRKTDTLRVQYRCEDENAVMGKRWVSEWICIEHGGWAGKKALDWWKKHSQNEFPGTIPEALEIIDNIGIAVPKRVKVVRDDKWDRVMDHEVGEIPPPEPVDWGVDEDCPF